MQWSIECVWYEDCPKYERVNDCGMKSAISMNRKQWHRTTIYAECPVFCWWREDIHSFDVPLYLFQSDSIDMTSSIKDVWSWKSSYSSMSDTKLEDFTSTLHFHHVTKHELHITNQLLNIKFQAKLKKSIIRMSNNMDFLTFDFDF